MTLYAVARIVKSFGTRGAVMIKPLTHEPQRFTQLRNVHVGSGAGDVVEMHVAEVNYTARGIMVGFREVPDRTSSDRLAGQYVFVDEQELLPPPPGSYFVHEVIGCRVRLNGEDIGIVVEVFQKDQGFAHDIWVVNRNGGEILIPAVHEFIEEIDLAAQQIVIRDLDGLLE